MLTKYEKRGYAVMVILVCSGVSLGLTIARIADRDPVTHPVSVDVRPVVRSTATVTAYATVTPSPVRVTVTARPTEKRVSRSTQRPAIVRTNAPAVRTTANWDGLAQCESGGNWSINTGNGYYGGLQFSLSTWRAFGGVGYPHHASRSEQIRIAERVLKVQGRNAWPGCTAKGAW